MPMRLRSTGDPTNEVTELSLQSIIMRLGPCEQNDTLQLCSSQADTGAVRRWPGGSLRCSEIVAEYPVEQISGTVYACSKFSNLHTRHVTLYEECTEETSEQVVSN